MTREQVTCHRPCRRVFSASSTFTIALVVKAYGLRFSGSVVVVRREGPETDRRWLTTFPVNGDRTEQAAQVLGVPR
jgi:hypothetical protein